MKKLLCLTTVCVLLLGVGKKLYAQEHMTIQASTGTRLQNSGKLGSKSIAVDSGADCGCSAMTIQQPPMIYAVKKQDLAVETRASEPTFGLLGKDKLDNGESTPRKFRKTFPNRLKVFSKSFHFDIGFFKRTGGVLKVWDWRKKRRWYCGWFCKKWGWSRYKGASSTLISNEYFAYNPRVGLYSAGNKKKNCKNRWKCKQREIAITVSLKSKGGKISPGYIKVVHPKGVLTNATITAKGRTVTGLTKAGKTP